MTKRDLSANEHEHGTGHGHMLPHDHGNELTVESLRNEINKVNDFTVAADMFKHLGDATRLRIFWFLCHCEECVLNIASVMNMSSPAVSHHLRILRNSDLIISRREGKEVFYSAAATKESALLHEMIEQMIRITCPKHD